jgi:hypothetical protein
MHLVASAETLLAMSLPAVSTNSSFTAPASMPYNNNHFSQ